MNIIEKIKNDKLINKIIAFSNSEKLYLVGGCIRDCFLNKENFDKDLVVDCKNPKEYAISLAKKLDAKFIELDSENLIYRLVLKDKVNFIDIAAQEGENIETDLKRRDLTINSIAIDLNNFEILDFNNGLEDLKKGLIRHISEKNLTDDYLRLLRVFRFQAALGFKIDDKLKFLVKKYGNNVTKAARERINYELLKLFKGKYAHNALLSMDESGLLEYLFPIMKEVKKVPKNSHHHLPLFMHSIETVKQIHNLYENSSEEVKKHMEDVSFGGESRLAHLKLAGFLHDIGKPQTWTIEQNTGRHRFIKHDLVGAELCSKILIKDKFSKKQSTYISSMIRQHIYPSSIVSASEFSDKVKMRFIRKMEDNSIDVILLAMADRLSARGEAITEDMVNDNISKLQSLLDFYINVKDTLKPLPKLLNGKEIMKILNIPASKKLGEIVNKLHEAQLCGEISTKDEAIDYIKNLI